MFPINDVLDAILLGGFFFGLLFTIGVLVLGVADVEIGHDAGADVGHDAGGHGDGLFHSLFNVSAILAFITWFGGVGYVARNGLGLWSWLAILIGIVGGVAGAAAVTWFIVKVLRNDDKGMNPADWEVVGVIGRVSSTVRPGGIGEIIYEQNGSRHLAAAKTTGAVEIPRETEVVVMRIEQGVAVVEPFAALLDDHETARLGNGIAKDDVTSYKK
ncbi:MAG TPA: hypothetical protein VNZ58_13285 [Thermomicrobiales bacterium]|nr:hypothetical protein [Thermomicrobiales bacterium]